jgi:hypothetical protein
MNKKSALLFSCGLAVALLSSQAANAAIITTHYWSLGEDGTIPKDSFSSNQPFTTGAGVVSTNTSGLNGSTQSLTTSGTGSLYGNGGTVTGLNGNNWVVELSTYFTAPSVSALMCFSLGNTNASQIGIDASGHLIFGTGSAATVFTSTPTLSSNAWHNIAWVNDAGTSEFYLDGALIGTDSVGNYGFSNNTSGNLVLFANYTGLAHFNGNLDNLRISTFSPGQFSTSDLMMNAVPEPGAWASLLGGCGVLMGLRRRRY